MCLLMSLFVISLCDKKEENENIKDKKQISNLNEVNLVNDCNQQKINDTGVGGGWKGSVYLLCYTMSYFISNWDYKDKG